MRKRMKQKYEELFKQNVSTLMKDEKEMAKIEERIDKRHMDRLGNE
ncbi:FbpB family small basic protein [Salipaludibacillus keqinensis]|uniref:FbpB family small basic protein n=1 Tax=Salipaludibacillus keqinensis TaxID=2045207 RepID=A0A323TMI5_9BACI|nr:FbpB family small basic protein [Salipaludibacillus keqinensis]PYZ95266.1 FbpB family small basic protein [Salipaludibacillus keqinensis]